MPNIKLDAFFGKNTGMTENPLGLCSVSTERTILSLKTEFYEKYEVPVERQVWIVRNMIARNNETLDDLKVSRDTFCVIYIREDDEMTIPNDEIQPDDFSQDFRNILSDKYNGAMLNPRGMNRPQPISPTVNAGTWACLSCTFHNKTSFTACQICGAGTLPVSPSAKQVKLATSPVRNNFPLPPPPPPGMTKDEILVHLYGWECPRCTLMNEATRPGCVGCHDDRPEYYELPAIEHLTQNDVRRLQSIRAEETKLRQLLAQERHQQAVEARANNHEHVHSEMNHQYFPNTEEFECPICMDQIAIGEGVILRNCAHMYCRQCMVDSIKASHDVNVTCPKEIEGDDPAGNKVVCAKPLQHREIAGILDNEEDLRERFRRAYVATAEHLGTLADNANANDPKDKVFQCLTPDCEYFLLYIHNDVGQFTCPLCDRQNCISCHAQHAPMTCKDYQAEQRRLQLRGEYENRDIQMEENLLRQHQAMRCPGCQRVTVKNGGCPNMHCVRCKTNFQWNP